MALAEWFATMKRRFLQNSRHYWYRNIEPLVFNHFGNIEKWQSDADYRLKKQHRQLCLLKKHQCARITINMKPKKKIWNSMKKTTCRTKKVCQHRYKVATMLTVHIVNNGISVPLRFHSDLLNHLISVLRRMQGYVTYTPTSSIQLGGNKDEVWWKAAHIRL